ncbi:MAG: DUF4157 domain-containing protein [Actinomycetota bacterium]|nr:DUF4157 domain-containing protein [Actinomycetota bacterium]
MEQRKQKKISNLHEMHEHEDPDSTSMNQTHEVADFQVDRQSVPGLLQLKLDVGRSDDPEEIEAENVADAFVWSEESAVKIEQDNSNATRQVGRQQASVSEVDPGPGDLRRGGFSVGEDFEQRLAKSSVGTSLPGGLQERLGTFLGADLSTVRLHTDGEAADLSRSVGAEAFTVGRDIYFGEGKYDPVSKAGQHLIAHEVTHTVQQRSVRRKGIALRRPGEPVLRRRGGGDLAEKRAAFDSARDKRESASQAKEEKDALVVSAQENVDRASSLDSAYKTLDVRTVDLERLTREQQDLNDALSNASSELEEANEGLQSSSAQLQALRNQYKKQGMDSTKASVNAQVLADLESYQNSYVQRAKRALGLALSIEEERARLIAKQQGVLAPIEAMIQQISERERQTQDASQRVNTKQTEVESAQTGKARGEEAVRNATDARDQASAQLQQLKTDSSPSDRDEASRQLLGARARLTQAEQAAADANTEFVRSSDAVRTARAALEPLLIAAHQERLASDRSMATLSNSKEALETASEGTANTVGQWDEGKKATANFLKAGGREAPENETEDKNLGATELVAKGLLTLTQTTDAIQSLASYEATGKAEAAQKSTKAVLTTSELVAKSVYFGKDLIKDLSASPGLEMVPVIGALGAFFSILEEISETTMPLWKSWSALNKQLSDLDGKWSGVHQEAEKKKLELTITSVSTLRRNVRSNWWVSFGKVTSDLAVATGSFLTLGGALTANPALAGFGSCIIIAGGLGKAFIGLGQFAASWYRALYASEVHQLEEKSGVLESDDGSGNSPNEVNRRKEYTELYQNVAKYHSETAYKHVVVRALLEDPQITKPDELLVSLGLNQTWIRQQRAEVKAAVATLTNLHQFEGGVIPPILLNKVEWDEALDLSVKHLAGDDYRTASEKLSSYRATFTNAFRGIGQLGNWVASLFRSRYATTIDTPTSATAGLAASLESLKTQSLVPYVRRKDVDPWKFAGLFSQTKHGVKTKKVEKFVTSHLSGWIKMLPSICYVSPEEIETFRADWEAQINKTLMDCLEHAPAQDAAQEVIVEGGKKVEKKVKRITHVEVRVEKFPDGRFKGISGINVQPPVA